MLPPLVFPDLTDTGYFKELINNKKGRSCIIGRKGTGLDWIVLVNTNISFSSTF